MARILGLDISELAVRATLARTGLRHNEIIGYFETAIAEAEGPEGRAEARREAITSLIAGIRPPPDGVVVALAGAEVSLRMIEIPAAAAKRLDEVLPFELESVLPFDPQQDPVIIDHQPVMQEGKLLKVLAAAAQRSRVAEHLAELRDAGIVPRELAVGAASLDGLVPLLDALRQAGPVLLLDLRADDADICILQDGRTVLARTISVGAEAAQDGRLESTLRQTLAAHRSQGYQPPALAFLSGPAACDPHALPWLAERLDLTMHLLPLPPASGADDTQRPAFAKSAALAMRTVTRGKRLDLRKGEFAATRASGVIRQHAKLLSACGLSVLLAFTFSMITRWSSLSSDQEALETELAKITEEAFGRPVKTAQRARELLNGGGIPDDPLPEFDAFDALDAISAGIPADITHDTRRLAIEFGDEGNTGRFDLQGSVASVAERDRIVESLETHRCFHEIKPGRATPRPGQGGLNYQIEAEIRCGAPPPPTKTANRRRSN